MPTNAPATLVTISKTTSAVPSTTRRGNSQHDHDRALAGDFRPQAPETRTHQDPVEHNEVQVEESVAGPGRTNEHDAQSDTDDPPKCVHRRESVHLMTVM